MTENSALINEIDIESLSFDDRNPNVGNDRGRDAVHNSITELGFGRSILIDKNGKILAGNKSTEAAIKAGLKTVKVIQTTGNEVIAVQRVDIDADSEEGKKFKVFDNRTSELGLTWSPEVLSELTGAGVDLSSVFTTIELDKLCEALQEELPDDDDIDLDTGEDEEVPQGIRQFNLFIAEEIYQQFCDKVDALLESKGMESATDLIVSLVMKE